MNGKAMHNGNRRNVTSDKMESSYLHSTEITGLEFYLTKILSLLVAAKAASFNSLFWRALLLPSSATGGGRNATLRKQSSGLFLARRFYER